MAGSFQRFKLLATQCALARSSPSRSPLPSFSSAGAGGGGGGGGRSPGLRLRRRRSRGRRGGTLRRLLSRGPPSPEPSDRRATADPEEGVEEKRLLSHKLRDLLIASPPLRGASGGEQRASAARRSEMEDAPPPPPPPPPPRRCGSDNPGGGGGEWGLGAVLGLRRRLLLRRVWRPMLVAIPE